MEVAYEADQALVVRGDSLEVLGSFPDDSMDSVITDPPYALSFMGKDWDALHPDPLIWKECLRVLKPGGHLLSFGGTRTYHRLACDIEDAGFDIRDSIAWLYGSGFPKSMDISKAIDKAAGAEREVVGRKTGRAAAPVHNITGGKFNDTTGAAQDTDIGAITAPATDEAKQWEGWGTALKPAFEPIIVARKPFKGTLVPNVLAHGTGGLNIDACRVEGIKDVPASPRRAKQGVTFGELGNDPGTGSGWDPNVGRWPTNVVMDEDQAETLDEQTGVLKSGLMKAGTKEKVGADVYGTYESEGMKQDTYGDSGGASRFFPVFKYQAKAPAKERPKVDGIAHPTVKPLGLMRWLVKLVTPEGGTVLDPFAGSGTTGEAALLEGMNCVLIERDAAYVPLIVTRIERLEP